MNKFSEFFATIKDGDIILVGTGFPPHELKENQIEITQEEYYLIRNSHYTKVDGVGIVEHLNHVIGMLSKKIGDWENKK